MNKDQNKINQTQQFADGVYNFCEKIVLVTWYGLKPFMQMVFRYPLPAISILGGGYYLLIKFVERAFHLRFLNWIWPSLFSGKFLNWLLHIPIKTHYNFIYFGTLWSFLVFLGARAIYQKRKMKENFESIGLANKFGQVPILIYQKQLDEFRDLMCFNAMSVGLDTFELKRQELEAAFGKPIESIKRSSDVKRVEIVFSTKRLSSGIHFLETAERQALKPDQFYVGETMKGILTTDIKKLPHLMIAGTTGAGKSVFFKQVLTSLLRSSNHLQIYFIDLKNGLEAIDFKDAPNVAIAKNTNEALYFLEKVYSEMNKRFKYLETKGFKSIEPQRDKMDRIVIAVDEASELYADKSKFDSDYEDSAQIQSLTNSIARLGRAAGIHLILATQKVNKESINTVIQENISARMCFKMNTLQGSLQVLGNKSALDLSTIPGRGIWQWGNEEFEVQVPFLAGHDIKMICEDVELGFKNGSKKLFQSMIGKLTLSDGIDKNSNGVRNSLVDIDA